MIQRPEWYAKHYLYTDLKRWNDLTTEVFAKEMTIDYSVMLGMPPFEITGEGCAQKFKGQVAHMDSTQHIIRQSQEAE
jgi:hypothetical protein